MNLGRRVRRVAVEMGDSWSPRSNARFSESTLRMADPHRRLAPDDRISGRHLALDRREPGAGEAFQVGVLILSLELGGHRPKIAAGQIDPVPTAGGKTLALSPRYP